MIKPMTPDQVRSAPLQRYIPDFVIEAFNQELVERSRAFDGREIQVMQDDVVDRILKNNPDINRQDIFHKKWLDVEDVFRASGWNVQYYKQPYYIEGQDFFLFKA